MVGEDGYFKLTDVKFLNHFNAYKKFLAGI